MSISLVTNGIVENLQLHYTCVYMHYNFVSYTPFKCYESLLTKYKLTVISGTDGILDRFTISIIFF